MQCIAPFLGQCRAFRNYHSTECTLVGRAQLWYTISAPQIVIMHGKICVTIGVFLGLAQRVLMNPAPSVRQSVRLSVTKVLILPVISFF